MFTVLMKCETIIPSRYPITLSKTDEIYPLAIQNPYECTYQVWWQSHDIYSSYRPERKYRRTEGRQTDTRTDTRPSNVKPKYPTTIVWRDIKDAIHNYSIRHFDFFFFFFFFFREKGLDISCELSASRRFTWNAKSYFLWKILRLILKCRLIQFA